ncbi:pantothenate kinase [Roseofilum casamattae]|uniref:Type III pantothenate kinase n=1 Tax=Roseofilum casamattae BLCC-M143 TaxID=3022442 RepID=A0ABT7BR46_9CYAN|nr:pantothenate kinase [Roseofilum casamattae]MDJ1181664.1 pantothenate kinase [Roseofilum casamattae BLCC-M143]
MWLALVMGNSRFHWGLCDRRSLLYRWDTPHLSPSEIDRIASDWDKGTVPEFLLQELALNHHLSTVTLATLPLVLSSVVPALTPLWTKYSQTRILTLADLPLNNTYLTLGIDRALAVVGAGEHWGWPVLVIDGGTALTLTGADRDRNLVGGAILPGLGLQIRALASQTGALPQISLSQPLPPRWSQNTEDAIASGIWYVLLSGLQDFIQNWHESYPDSAIIFTGGDGEILHERVQQAYPQLSSYLHCDRDLVFRGYLALHDLEII